MIQNLSDKFLAISSHSLYKQKAVFILSRVLTRMQEIVLH